MKERDFVQIRQKIYWKYHVAAVLGLHIVLAAFGTPDNVNDTVMLRTMLGGIRRRGFGFSGRRFNADRGYDSDANCGVVFLHGMIPQHQAKEGCYQPEQARQEEGGRTAQPRRVQAGGPDRGDLRSRGDAGHQLRCRLVRAGNRRRFAKGRAIAWNSRVLNRFEHANRLRIPISSYGAQARSAPEPGADWPSPVKNWPGSSYRNRWEFHTNPG